jgi:hypothetical protein
VRVGADEARDARRASTWPSGSRTTIAPPSRRQAISIPRIVAVVSGATRGARAAVRRSRAIRSVSICVTPVALPRDLPIRRLLLRRDRRVPREVAGVHLQEDSCHLGTGFAEGACRDVVHLGQAGGRSGKISVSYDDRCQLLSAQDRCAQMSSTSCDVRLPEQQTIIVWLVAFSSWVR